MAICAKDLYTTPMRKKLREILGESEQELKRKMILEKTIKRSHEDRVLAKLFKVMEMEIWGEVIDLPSYGGHKPQFSQSEHYAKMIRQTDRYWSLIPGLVTQRMSDAKLVLWWRDNKLVPSIYCPDLRTAVHVLALPFFMGGKVIAICPWCKQLFCALRSDQVYCTKRHAEAHRVARWRAKVRRKGRLQRKSRPAD